MFNHSWYLLGQKIVKLYLNSLLKADVVRKATLPDGPKIIAVNHPSTADPAYVTAIFGEKISILINEVLFRVPLFGRSLAHCGHIPVEPGKGKEALEGGLQALREGRSVMIFPEGVISPEHGFAPAHTGVARLALLSGAPVVPVGIGLDSKHLKVVETVVSGVVEPSSWYFSGPYALTVGEAFHVHGDIEIHSEVRAATEAIMQRIRLLTHESNLRIETGEARNSVPVLPVLLNWLVRLAA